MEEALLGISANDDHHHHDQEITITQAHIIPVSDDDDGIQEIGVFDDSAIKKRLEEAQIVHKVLCLVQKHEQARIQEGFNEINFTVGVLNFVLVAYIFGNYPEHFWLLWFLEALVLIPLKIYQDWHAQPLRQILYYLDYCWVMNFLMILSLYSITLDLGQMPFWVRKNIYLTIVGVCCGPLLAANLLPFVAVVFHDNKLMTSVFIHLTPPMLLYTFMWHADEIRQAWPSFFHLDVLDRIQFYPRQAAGPLFWPGQGWGSVSGNATALYVLWYIPYYWWMWYWGLDLTRTHRRRRDRQGRPLVARYDTAFHSILRNGLCETLGTWLWGRPVAVSRQQASLGEYERRDLVAFMVLHAMMCWVVTNVVARICCASKIFHAAVLWMMAAVAVFRGAQRYVYWVTSVTSAALQEEFGEILQAIKQA